MYKSQLFCCILSLIVFTTSAQTKTAQQKLDSLLLVDKSYHQEDSVKYIILRNIMIQYSRLKNSLQTEEYTNKALAFAAKMNKPAWQAAIYYRRALGYHGENNYLKAEENYYQSIAKYTIANELDWVAANYQNLGALYTGIPDYIKALDVHQKAIAIYNKLGDEEAASNCYTNIGILYNNLGQQSG